ncbi:PASTA domain-containing protein [Actinosynnema sp. NPDC051121]
MKIPLAMIVTAAALLTGCTPTTGALGPTKAQDAVTPTTIAVAVTPPVGTTTIAAPAPAAPKTCTVPDVVGMVHQDAQDTMQAAGLYNLREQDSTGQGRVLVVDRNWTTTAQSVAAGQVVDCKTEILLSAKKIGE